MQISGLKIQAIDPLDDPEFKNEKLSGMQVCCFQFKLNVKVMGFHFIFY